MYAEIDSDGKLLIKPESKTEEWALNVWMQTNFVQPQEDQKPGDGGYWRRSSLLLLAADARKSASS